MSNYADQYGNILSHKAYLVVVYKKKKRSKHQINMNMANFYKQE
jgi:hypothetical protein